MKTILLTTILLICSISFGQESKTALFLGNSYTNYNNLPQMTKDLAFSAGDTLLVDSNTPGGYTLNGHSTNATSLAKIQAGGWDYVILQEQSQLPSFPIGQVQTQSFPYAQFLDSVITATDPCTETMFYMTWGRENGDASNCASWPPVCTYQGMDSLLRLRYDQMATDNQGVVSPIGPLWKYLRNAYPMLQLYASDGSHPSLEGSYAAACSFYTTIFRKDPTMISDDYGLDPVVAMSIRDAAKLVVFDSLSTWHVGEYDPVASFTSQSSFLTGAFTNTSLNASTYLWDFGDGQTSTIEHPLHVYALCGWFDITLTATDDCGVSASAFDSIFINPAGCGVGLKEISQLNARKISPNPVSDLLQIDLENIAKVTVIDALGKEAELTVITNGEGAKVDMSNFSAGMYYLKIESDGKIFGTKVMKE